MKFSKEELGHLVHSKDLENRVWKPFWSAPEELGGEGEGAEMCCDERDSLPDANCDGRGGHGDSNYERGVAATPSANGRSDWKDEWSVSFEDFQSLTLSSLFINNLRGDVKSRALGLIEVFLDSPDKEELIAEKCGIVKTKNGIAMDGHRAFGYSIIEDLCRESGDDDLIAAAGACKTEILKVCTFMELFDRCGNFKECSELFDQLVSSRKFSEDLLCGSIFEQWIKKCRDINEVMIVLGKMEEFGVAPSPSVVVSIFSTITDENHEDIFKKIEKIEPVKKVLQSIDFSIEYVRRFANTIEDVKMFIDKFMPLGCKFGEIVFFEFLRKCTSFIDGLVVFGIINSMVKKGGNDVPDIVLAELFRLAGRDADKWVNVIKSIHSKEIPVSKTLIDDLKLPADACVLIKERFAKTVKFDGDFETVYGEYKGRRLAKTRGYSRSVMDFYEKFRKGAMELMDHSYICECKTAEDFVFMVRRMYEEGFEPTQNIIEGLNLSTDECLVAKRLLTEFFEKEGVDMEEFYNVSRLKLPVIAGEGFVKIYGYVRDRVVVDEVEDVFGLVVTMLEEGVAPSDEFISSLDLSGKKWPVFKQVLEERLRGEEMDPQWSALYKHVCERAGVAQKEAQRAKVAKKKRRFR